MYPRGVRAQPIKVVKALETTGQIPQEDIDAKLEAERQKRRARAERFGVEYKEPTIVRLRNSRTTDNTQEELFHEGFVTKKRYYSNVEPVNVTGNLYTNQKEKEEKKSKRARRFASSLDSDSKQETPKPLSNTKRHITYSTKSAPALVDITGPLELRRDTVCVYGTDNMATKDIFRFFRAYGPSYVEWIDDSSCTVVFQDEQSSLAALINLTAEYKKEDTDEVVIKVIIPQDVEDMDISSIPTETTTTSIFAPYNDNQEEEINITDDVEEIDIGASSEIAPSEATEPEPFEIVVRDSDEAEAYVPEPEIDIGETNTTEPQPEVKEEATPTLESFIQWHHCTDPSFLNIWLKVALTTDKKDPSVRKRSRFYEKMYGVVPSRPPAPTEEERAAKRVKREEQESPRTPAPTESRTRRLQLHSSDSKTSIFSRLSGIVQPTPTAPPEEYEVAKTEETEQIEAQAEDIDLGTEDIDIGEEANI